MHKSDSFNIDNNEINFGLKSQKNYKEKYGMNSLFRNTKGIKSFMYSPKIMINNSLEELKDLNNNNLRINQIKKKIYFLKLSKY